MPVTFRFHGLGPLAIVVASVLAFSLTGCSGGGSRTPTGVANPLATASGAGSDDGTLDQGGGNPDDGTVAGGDDGTIDQGGANPDDPPGDNHGGHGNDDPPGHG